MSANDIAILIGGTSRGASRERSGTEAAPLRGLVWPIPTDRRVRCLEALMRRELHRRIPLAEPAAMMGISVSRLSHLFSAQTGTSPLQYLKLLRLGQARIYLQGSSLSMKEVAARVGLNPSRFAREFRQMYGETPGQYRLRCQDLNLLCDSQFRA